MARFSEDEETEFEYPLDVELIDAIFPRHIKARPASRRALEHSRPTLAHRRRTTKCVFSRADGQGPIDRRDDIWREDLEEALWLHITRGAVVAATACC